MSFKPHRIIFFSTRYISTKDKYLQLKYLILQLQVLHYNRSTHIVLQAALQQRAADREAAFAQRIAEQEAAMSAQDVRARNAKLLRREHFREMEAEGQKRRTMEASVRSQQSGILRSQVLPTGDTLPQQCACGAGN